MDQVEKDNTADEAYRERLRSSTLSELEDMYAHLDRLEYVQRLEMVQAEIEERFRRLDERPMVAKQPGQAAGFFRRIWAGFVDLFVHLLILAVLFFVGRSVMSLVSSFAEEPSAQIVAPPRRGPSPLQQFASGLIAGDSAAWKNVEQWRRVGLFLLGFLLYKAFLTVPVWARTGATPGMREVGIRLESAGGESLSFKQALARFGAQYLLFFLTLGISALWVLWDRQGKTLHDKLAGTRIVRELRSWEKPFEARVYD